MSEYDDKVLRAAKQTIMARRDGRNEPIEVFDAMIAKRNEGALKGSPMAGRGALADISRALAAQEARAAERYEAWGKLKAKQAASLRTAETAGQGTEHILPHPDDIILGGPEGAHLVGPMNAEDAISFRQRAQFRDTLILQQLVEDAVNMVPVDARPTMGSPMILAVLINQLLPPSLRRSEREELQYLLRAGCGRTRRELLRDCRAAWRALGVTVKSGRCLPGVEEIKLHVDISFEVCASAARHPDSRQMQQEAIEQAQSRLREELPAIRRQAARKTSTAEVTV